MVQLPLYDDKYESFNIQYNNIMNAWKLTIYSICAVVVFLLIACGDHLLESPLVMDPSTLGMDDYFEATIDLKRTGIDAVEFIPEQILGIGHEGNGRSNLLGNISLTSYHQERLISHYIAPRIEFGKFTLQSETNKDALTGTYTGSGAYWVLNVQGGTGRFVRTSGSLNVHINDKGSNGITARISGYLNQ